MMLRVKQNHPVTIAALADVNAARYELGLPTLAEMPSGTDSEATDCPVYHGLMNGHAVEVLGQEVWVNTVNLARTLAAVWETEITEFGVASSAAWPVKYAERPSRVADPGEAEGTAFLYGYRVMATEDIAEFVTLFDAGELMEDGFDA